MKHGKNHDKKMNERRNNSPNYNPNVPSAMAQQNYGYPMNYEPVSMPMLVPKNQKNNVQVSFNGINLNVDIDRVMSSFGKTMMNQVFGFEEEND